MVTVVLNAADEVVHDCLAVRIRLVARAVTSLYDQALERHGLSIAQVNLLAAVGKFGPCTPTDLGGALQLDRSTVSRNVNLLTKRGWIEAVSADAKGVREVALTVAGRRKLESVLSEWRKAQGQAERLLGPASVAAVRAMADDIGHIPNG